MKKRLSALLSILLVLGLVVGCTPKAPATKGTYNAFALAAGLGAVFDGEADYHSKNIRPFGEGVSTNTSRYSNPENDRLIEEMRKQNPNTAEGVAEYQRLFREWVKLMNDELPLVPMYSNEYYDGYNSDKLTSFVTKTMFGWQQAILKATVADGVESITVGTPEYNGEFIQGWGNSSYDAAIRDLVAESMLTTNEEGEMVWGGMLENLVVSDDQKEWTFTLKDGLKFSDGAPLTTNDVLFTFLFYSDPTLVEAEGSPAYHPEELGGFAEYHEAAKDGNRDVSLFTGIEVVDDHVIKFTVPEPIFGTWSKLFTYHILPAHLYAPDGLDKIDVKTVVATYLNNPVGSGAYKLVDYVHNEFVTLELNDLYVGDFDGDKPVVPRIIGKVVSSDTDHEQLIAGDIDILPGLIEWEKIQAIDATDGRAVNGYPRHGYGYVAFHTDYGVGSFKEIRQAFAWYMDRDAFGQAMIGPNATLVHGPYSLTYWMIDEAFEDAELVQYQKDPAKARAVLEAAGWVQGDDGIYAKNDLYRNEIKAVITVGVGNNAWKNNLDLLLADSVAEAGFQVNIEVVDFNVLLDHFYGAFKG